MTGDLFISLGLTEHPVPRHRGVYLDPWGRFIFTIIIDGQGIVLLDRQWGLDELAEGFVANRDALRTESLSVMGETTLPGESLAQAKNRFRDREDFIDQESFDRFYEVAWSYYRKHAPQSWMTGVAMPDIIVGLNRGIGEISLDTDQESWAYTFDMNIFLERFRQELLRVLTTWIAATAQMGNATGYRVGRSRVKRCLDVLEQY